MWLFFSLLFIPVFFCEGVCLRIFVCVYANVPLFRKLSDWSIAKVMLKFWAIWNRNLFNKKEKTSACRNCVYNHLYFVKFNSKMREKKASEKERQIEMKLLELIVTLMGIIALRENECSFFLFQSFTLWQIKRQKCKTCYERWEEEKKWPTKTSKTHRLLKDQQQQPKAIEKYKTRKWSWPIKTMRPKERNRNI